MRERERHRESDEISGSDLHDWDLLENLRFTIDPLRRTRECDHVISGNVEERNSIFVKVG